MAMLRFGFGKNSTHGCGEFRSFPRSSQTIRRTDGTESRIVRRNIPEESPSGLQLHPLLLPGITASKPIRRRGGEPGNLRPDSGPVLDGKEKIRRANLIPPLLQLFPRTDTAKKRDGRVILGYIRIALQHPEHASIHRIRKGEENP
jgi:hypothetical protein